MKALIALKSIVQGMTTEFHLSLIVVRLLIIFTLAHMLLSVHLRRPELLMSLKKIELQKTLNDITMEKIDLMELLFSILGLTMPEEGGLNIKDLFVSLN